MQLPRSIFITGASSGIGKAIAIAYAHVDTILFLCGRNPERLQSTANLCKEKGATVYTYLFDVTEAFAAQEAINQADAISQLELVIANAGISGGVLADSRMSEETRQIMETNINGVVNIVLPALDRMRKRHKGQIAIVSSIAGFHGIPSAPAYSASKCCVKAWGEALRGWLCDEGVKINVICPGFVQTPLTSVNRFRMPFLMSPEKAALEIKKGLAKNKAIIAFPWPMAFSGWLMSALPALILHPILNRLPKK